MKNLKPWLIGGLVLTIIYLTLVVILWHILPLVAQQYAPDNNAATFGFFVYASIPGFFIGICLWSSTIANALGLTQFQLFDAPFLIIVSAIFYFILGILLRVLYDFFTRRRRRNT